ncbi:hypothetical protein EOD10_09605 [Mesorhizobium sp. M7A.T.Ca.TU.009.01.3.2]|uniref:hypothetical protein n=1 Tax=unclassified Mesorhizobium TaxID=325217 RepID=UPI000A623280|nr:MULTISPECIES: hypothetical protein [unclassified Mesorhizobium]RUU17382.1 hypothetical protein EOD10_09605 [Mesorhizobium sp. M7A.T.Ca.TU.009.01.3.2]RUV14393.1 hypothetical protein EOD00_01750 [Mesorhizobium sp. M7A.T.Ca.TU.009.01.3.1]RUV33760.1 hypothetical protein EOB49_29085 [Mesorhizobium sp. M7A.F.Ca.MR.148.00.0.0]RUZ58661.1 hypothetical protein EN956_00415 [Mesorhizobium sp. M7A.F.Ca.CA.004.05.2.1]RUZ82079.1 hypothetical protein EN947_18455 [Mesorhizobium sp. M7A.F.Ca.US.003.02.2.1]R
MTGSIRGELIRSGASHHRTATGTVDRHLGIGWEFVHGLHWRRRFLRPRSPYAKLGARVERVMTTIASLQVKRFPGHLQSLHPAVQRPRPLM